MRDPSKLDQLARDVARETPGCGGSEADRWCWGDKKRGNCSCRNKAQERLRARKPTGPEPKKPLRVFHQRNVIEVQDADGRVVIKWTGFEASDFGPQVQKRIADACVRGFNKVKP